MGSPKNSIRYNWLNHSMREDELFTLSTRAMLMNSWKVPNHRSHILTALDPRQPIPSSGALFRLFICSFFRKNDVKTWINSLIDLTMICPSSVTCMDHTLSQNSHRPEVEKSSASGTQKLKRFTRSDYSNGRRGKALKTRGSA